MLVAVAVATAALSGASSVAIARQGRGAGEGPPVLTVQKLRDDLYVLRSGARANSGVFIGQRGVVIVDVRGGWGQPLRDAIGKLTPKPITTIINTHSHPGHVTGNPEGFAPTVEIVAHAAAAARMRLMPVFVQSNGRGLPTRTFNDRLALGTGSDRVDLYHFGRGHTDGDAWVVFPSARTLYVDIFPGPELPLLDPDTGASGTSMPATLERAIATLGNGVDTVITGHGPVMTIRDLREFAAFNRDFLETVRAAKRAGRSVDEIAAVWKLPARWGHYATPTPEFVRRNVELIFAETN
jgi:cyclase